MDSDAKPRETYEPNCWRWGGLGVLLAATLPDNVSYILYSIFLALILGGGLEYIVFHILVARDRPVDVHDAA